MTTPHTHSNDKSDSTDDASENRRPASVEPAPIQTIVTVGAEESIAVFSSTAAFELGQRKAKALAAGTLVPEQYRGNVANCLIALELASRLGISVMAVMQHIDVIHGRPSWRATFMIAIVNACGRFTPLRFRWEGKAGTPTYGCRAVASDRETGEELVGTAITWAMVDGEGWAKKTGSKWKTMPEQMFQYRAAAFWARIYAPELLLGLRTSDENEDIGGPVAQTQVVRRAPAPRLINQFLASRSELISNTAPPEEPADEPEPDDAVIDPEATEVDPDDDGHELPDEYV
jgi:hypothetical protein